MQVAALLVSLLITGLFTALQLAFALLAWLGSLVFNRN